MLQFPVPAPTLSISHEPKQASLEEATAGRFPPAAGELLPQKEGVVDPRRQREFSHLLPSLPLLP
jgi:hypothetical protein